MYGTPRTHRPIRTGVFHDSGRWSRRYVGCMVAVEAVEGPTIFTKDAGRGGREVVGEGGRRVLRIRHRRAGF